MSSKKVIALLEKMSLQEKIGQMSQFSGHDGRFMFELVAAPTPLSGPNLKSMPDGRPILSPGNTGLDTMEGLAKMTGGRKSG